MRHANYRLIANDHGSVLIEDVGPWDEHPTITNDVEWVLEDLKYAGALKTGQRLYYYDSEGELAEIVFDISLSFKDFIPMTKGAK